MNTTDLLRQLLLVGIGTTSLVIEQVSRLMDELVQKGSLNPDEARRMIDSVLEQVKTEQGNVEAQMQRLVRNTMQDLGVPRQAEMDELRGRLDRLERQVRALEDRLG
ncbi:MAG: phasin family protein [Synechococcaceae cyanobacterium SM2_3_60]|nr:phasin family protein [Synechococcaceae cyanobacterium SM2_3_60]